MAPAPDEFIIERIDVAGIIEPMRSSSPSIVNGARGKRCGMDEASRVSFREKANQKHDARLGFRHAQLDRALLLIERLIGDDGEPELVGIKIQRPVLVGHWNGDELDVFDHGGLTIKAAPR